MTPIVDINMLAVQNLPPNKRKPVWIMVMQALVYPLVWLMGIFRQYQNGGVTLFFDVSVTYGVGIRVVYNYRVYESLVSGNVGNVPDISPDEWTEVNSHFIGVNERARYQGKKLILEYALNRYFAGELQALGFIGFRQPNSAFSPTPSDIFITDVAPDDTSFIMYPDISSFMYPTYSTGYMYDPPVIVGTSSFQFDVNIPTTVFAQINSDPTIAEQIVRNFVNKYRVMGTYFNVITY